MQFVFNGLAFHQSNNSKPIHSASENAMRKAGKGSLAKEAKLKKVVSSRSSVKAGPTKDWATLQYK
ncbi:hypothetical protein C9I92_13725 [Photobacterium ganghwense]|uniref:Uncharacterized protein n=1 Tax=Photobacterium ganghwense TaxID=320778 RepID=A0A0J1HCJ8_9GAMM|nr:hypothetical protein ABT57_11355 [Photobacterium ganghwense]PSU08559.1 hypothetical protein C9I92_13725 [Photobacterium ganghwense]